MTLSQRVLTILIIRLGTMLTRFLPFLIFPANKTPPPYIKYLGRVLPYAVIGLLVVYCLKDAFGGGTVFYMFLAQNFFEDSIWGTQLNKRKYGGQK